MSHSVTSDVSPADRIFIRDLMVRGIIGVHDWERKERQDIVINVELSCDLRRCGESDDLADSVNYRTIAKQIIAWVESRNRLTVEALATDIAKICCAMAGVRRTRVRVEKPAAVRFAASVGVEIERTPTDFASTPLTGSPS